MKPVSPPAMLPALGSSLASELLAPGTEIGPYELESLITFGLAGGLYSAVTRLGRQRVCVWIVPTLASAQKDFRKRFYNVCNALADVKNQSVHIPKRVEWSDQRGLVEMPPLDWPTLEQILLSNREASDLEEDIVRKILIQVASALASAHKRGVCHLNCTPANIFLSPDNRVKVGGFGFIESLGSEVFQRLTSASVPPVRGETWNASLHTNDLRAPELLAGNEATQATDIYYFGVLAYFLITGRRLPLKESEPPSALRPTIHPGWDILIGRCLDTVSVRQTLSMASIARDLEGLEQLKYGGIWGQEAPHQHSSSKRKFSFSRKYLFGGIAALFLGAIASGILLLDFGGSEETAPRVKLATSAVDANFKLSVTPHRFLASFAGSGSGKFHQSDGQLWARLPSGEYEVTIEAANHYPQTIRFSPGASPSDQVVELKPAFADVILRTAPNAVVEVVASDGQARYLTTADHKGAVEIQDRLFRRSYQLQITASGYYPRNESVDLTADGTIDLPLAGHPVNLEVTGSAGATLWLDGEKVGSLPVLLEGIESGREISLRVEAAGSRPILRQIFLPAGEDTQIDLAPLEASTGEIEVNVVSDFNVPRGEIQIEVDGTLHSAGDRTRLSAGKHVLKIFHPDFYPEERLVEIKDRGYTRINVHLQPRPAKLELRVNQKQAFDLTIDGVKVITSGAGVLELEPGREIELEVSAPDHLITRRRLTFRPNEVRVWNVELVVIPGPQENISWQLPYSSETFAWIPSGTFTLGSSATEPENRPNETPVTQVVISKGYWMASREVSQSFWSQYMDSNRSEFRGEALPVHNVTWQEAVEFCKRLTQREAAAGRLPAGYVYRLPTEAEWEYACRAGSSLPFSFGDLASPVDGHFVGSYPRTAGSEAARPSAGYGPVAIATFRPNAFQLFDMHGNIAEWCIDYFNARYPGGTVVDWQGPAEGSDRAVRGGSWRDFAHRSRSAARDRLAPLTRSNAVGFRVVLAPELTSR